MFLPVLSFPYEDVFSPFLDLFDEQVEESLSVSGEGSLNHLSCRVELLASSAVIAYHMMGIPASFSTDSIAVICLQQPSTFVKAIKTSLAAAIGCFAAAAGTGSLLL